MTAGWARPLEALFGGPLDRALTAATFQRLVDEGVAEGGQHDYKVGRYPAAAEGREELAKDVCAFANRQGGILILGIAEVEGIASSCRPLADVGDGDVRHVRTTVASWCAPVPDLDVVIVLAADGTDTGFIVVVVPPSTRAPHAVAPPSSPNLRWPIRRGTQTAWLSESEIADAYHARASRVAEEHARLDELLGRATLSQLKMDDDPWLVTALFPASARSTVPIDSEIVKAYSEWLWKTSREIPSGDPGDFRASGVAGPRCVIFTSSTLGVGTHSDDHIELHTDGASVQADQMRQGIRSPDRPFNNLAGNTRFLWEDVLADLALIHLLRACRHAVDNAGAWSEASVAMILSDGGHQHLRAPVVLATRRAAFRDLVGPRVVHRDVPRSAITVDVGAVAAGGREAVLAARLLGGGMANVFGAAELSQYTHDGMVRRDRSPARTAAQAWAERHGLLVRLA